MKLNEQTLKQLIREVMDSELSSSLSGGAGVSGAALHKRFRDAGEEIRQLGANKEVTNNENKVIKKFVDLLTQGAEELDMDQGASFTLLNRIYKIMLQHLQKELKQQEADAEQGAAQTTTDQGDTQ